MCIRDRLEGISNINNADKNVFSELKKIFLQKQKQGRPVSYTHLDVYKRQELAAHIFGGIFECVDIHGVLLLA